MLSIRFRLKVYGLFGKIILGVFGLKLNGLPVHKSLRSKKMKVYGLRKLVGL